MAVTKQDYEVIRELMKLRNVGRATAGDLVSIGINSVEDLKKREPDEMYVALCEKTHARQDPCVWDVFRAVTHYAKTGEAKDWWEFTPERKARGEFNLSPL